MTCVFAPTFVRASLFSLSLVTISAGCASSGAVPRPFPGGDAPKTPAEASRSVGAAVAETALTFRGVPYRNGGSDPSGFDCSGLVQYVFAQHGLILPREVREQFAFGLSIPPERIETGDLLFFATTGRGPSHVGIAIGGDEFVHAPSSRGSVRVERFTAPYWADRLVGIRRVN
jgi:cell wall-associated NlpC family hydrolase